MEQKALNIPNPQVHIFAKAISFTSYDEAQKDRDSERVLIEQGQSSYSKAKVVRRGYKRNTHNESFVLKLYVLKNPPREEKAKKDTKKQNKKGRKQE